MTTVMARPTRAHWNQPDPYIGLDRQNYTLVGAGKDLLLVIHTASQAMEEYFRLASRQAEDVSEKFFRLATEWKQATMFVSSVTKMSAHPAYQQIIGMGEEAVPLLLKELARELDHWFWALQAITGVDPVPPSDAGDVERMAAAWVQWGREQGHV